MGLRPILWRPYGGAAGGASGTQRRSLIELGCGILRMRPPSLLRLAFASEMEREMEYGIN